MATYKIEKDQFLSYTLWYLNLLGVYPWSWEKSYYRRFLVKFFFIRTLCVAVSTVLPAHHLVTSIQDGIKTGISEDLSVSLGTAGSIATAYLVIYQASKWSQFFCDITNYEKYGRYSGVDKIRKKLNMHARIFFWYMFTGIVMYGVTTYGDTGRCEETNQLNTTLRELCGAFLQTRTPFEVTELWIKLTIFFVQIVIIFVSLVPGGLTCFIVYETTEILITHILLLKEYLIEAFEKDGQAADNMLKFCIRYHIHILSLAERFCYITKYTIGHMLLMAATVFACIVNQIFKVNPFGAIFFLIGYMLALVWLCQAGQRISDEEYTQLIDVRIEITTRLFRISNPGQLQAIGVGLDSWLRDCCIKTPDGSKEPADVIQDDTNPHEIHLRYISMINNFLWPKLHDMDTDDIWFQQDGAMCHTAHATMNILHERFEDMVISRSGVVNWSPSSFWGYLKSQTSDIGNTVYNAKWYAADVKSMRMALLIIIRSQRPVTLEGLPLGSYNYVLFLTILKTSYSYLAMINQST